LPHRPGAQLNAPENPAKGYAAVSFAVIVWAGWIVATRDQAARVSPLDISILRYGVPALLLAPVWLRKGIFPRGEDPWALTVMTVGWGGLFVMLTSKGLQTIDAALFGPMVPAALPLFVAFWDWAMNGVRIGTSRGLGLALIAASIALIVGPAFLRGDAGFFTGAPYLVLAACGWSAFTIAYRRSSLNGLEATAYVCLYSLPFFLVGVLVYGTRLHELSLGEAAYLVTVQGILSGIGAVASFGYAVKFLGAARTSSFTSLVPVLAALGAWLFLGEAVGPAAWVSVICACLGVAIVNGARGMRWGRKSGA
jgi:drug/metabolite transporter (DMT)-like permease